MKDTNCIINMNCLFTLTNVMVCFEFAREGKAAAMAERYARHSDRYAKKAKILFDPREKEKHRVAALHDLISKCDLYLLYPIVVEIMESEEEKRVFIRDNIEYISQLAVDAFQISADRIERTLKIILFYIYLFYIGERDYRERFERAMGKSSFDDIFLFPRCLELLIEYGGPKLYDQPTLGSLQEAVRRLVVPAGHPLLRREGMRLVFFWMKRKMTEEMREIFATAVELRQFCADPTLNIGQADYPPCGRALVEAPLSKQNQAEAMFEDILGLLTFDPDANRPALSLLWKELQRSYLALLYPSVFSEYKLVRAGAGGFTEEAPPRLQAILLRFLMLWLQRDPEQPQVDRLPVACFLLEEMLLTSPVESEIVHEVLRQGLLLPWEHAGTIRSVMALLRWWVFQPAGRRPPFLRTDLHGLLPSQETSELESGLMEVYTERYIRRVQSLFDCRPSFGVEEGQAEAYRDGLAFLRAVALGHYWRPTPKVWAALSSALLAMAQSHLTLPLRDAPITVPEHQAYFAATITETLLGTFVRSACKDAGQWERLSSVLSDSTHWQPVLIEWSRALSSLTSLLLTSAGLEPTPSSMRFVRIASDETLPVAQLPFSQPLSPRLDTFLTWSPQLVAPLGLPFLWRNWLRILGSPAHIESPEGLELVIRTMVTAWEQLRALPVYSMDVVEALFDTFEMQTGRAQEASRCAILATLSALMLRAGQRSRLPSQWTPRFALAVITGLADKDTRLAAVVLRSLSHLHTSKLPMAPASILVPAMMRTIGAGLNGPLNSLETMTSQLRILSSMAVLSSVYGDLPVPRLEAPLPSMSASLPVAHTGDVTLVEAVRQQVPCLLGLALDRLLEQHQSSTATPYTTLLGAGSIVLMTELYSRNVNGALLDQCASLLLSALDTGMATPAAAGALLDALADGAARHPAMDKERSLFLAQSLLSILHAADGEDVAVLRGLWAWLLRSSEGQLRPPLARQLLDHFLGAPSEQKYLALSHILHQLGAYPRPAPAALPAPELAMALGTDALFAMEQRQGVLHLATHNAIGQHSWCIEPVVPEKISVDEMPASLDLGQAIVMSRLEPYKPIVRATLPTSRLPIYSPEISLESTDMLAALLTHLDEEFPEAADTTVRPDHVSPDRREAVAEMRDAREELVAKEESLARQSIAALSTPNSTRLGHRRARPTMKQEPLARFHLGRTLLSHLGLLTMASTRSARLPLGLLGNSKALRRELDHLSQLPARSQHKIALLYSRGATTEEELLAGEEPSEDYEDFCRALGAYQSISALPFAGGLQPGDTRNGRVLAYGCPTHSLVFHEPCRFASPTDPITIKRHIGNDAVHVVWNESREPYDPSLIHSDYGNLQIVITPRPEDGLYAIAVHADTRFVPERLATGPLFHGALLPRALLAPLVRATAVAADRVLSGSSAQLSPAVDRQAAIKQIVEKQSLGNWSPAQILAHVILPPASSGFDEAMPSPVVI